MKKILCFIAITIVLPARLVFAGDGNGIYFYHNDWEVACDNTLTCRAAGYQGDDDDPDFAVSVLLMRKAGPRQPVTGRLEIGGDSLPKTLPTSIRLKMIINGRGYGTVAINMKNLKGELTIDQVMGLVSSLRHKSKIEFVSGKNVWHLSDKGGAAVLLKMDAVQGRVGTIGALIRKGRAGEGKVKAPIPVPVLVAARVPKQDAGPKQLSAGELKYLRNVLRQTVKEDDCPNLYEKGSDESPDDSQISIASLTGKKMLASTSCWMAAYNTGDGYWVIDDSRPYKPVLVTADGTDFSKGELESYQKGRGLADCVNIDDWNWDGKQFVHTQSLSMDLCKGFPGGAWKLPTLVTKVSYH